MRAPSSYTWLGLGIGSRMNGAEIFLMYADGNGNVTVSPRRGTGHVMPQYSQRSFELLEGSGIENDTMVANIRCRDCSSLKLDGSNNWISAWQEGEPLDSTEIDASITKHDDKEQFEVDFAQASISSDSNPFVGGDTNNNSGNGNGSGGGSNPPVVTGGGGGGGSSNTLPWAHGIIMMLVFVVMYPVGGILMPALGKWFIHASWQMVAFLAMWAGLGIGYTMAHRQGIVSPIADPHGLLFTDRKTVLPASAYETGNNGLRANGDPTCTGLRPPSFLPQAPAPWPLQLLARLVRPLRHDSWHCQRWPGPDAG